MDWLITALSSSGLGSIVGLAGGLTTKYFELRMSSKEMAFKLESRKLDLQEGAQERAHELGMADKTTQRAQIEGAIKVEELDVSGFIESQKSNVVTESLRWVRPAITFYLLFASSVLFKTLWGKTGGLDDVPKAELIEMLLIMINSALFLTVTCVSWWFGSRGGNIGKSK